MPVLWAWIGCHESVWWSHVCLRGPTSCSGLHTAAVTCCCVSDMSRELCWLSMCVLCTITVESLASLLVCHMVLCIKEEEAVVWCMWSVLRGMFTCCRTGADTHVYTDRADTCVLRTATSGAAHRFRLAAVLAAVARDPGMLCRMAMLAILSSTT